MPEQQIGARLDALGLTVDMEDGEVVESAEVTVTTGAEWGSTVHRLQKVPKPQPGDRPVPMPHERRIRTVVDEHTELSDEQRERASAWLRANDIDPGQVSLAGPVTIETHGGKNALICFTQYYVGPDGRREADLRTHEAVTFQRAVPQRAELPPEPEREGDRD